MLQIFYKILKTASYSRKTLKGWPHDMGTQGCSYTIFLWDYPRSYLSSLYVKLSETILAFLTICLELHGPQKSWIKIELNRQYSIELYIKCYDGCPSPALENTFWLIYSSTHLNSRETVSLVMFYINCAIYVRYGSTIILSSFIYHKMWRYWYFCAVIC